MEPNNLPDQNLITKYFSQQLTEKEQEQFQERMQDDSFRQEIEKQQYFLDSLKDIEHKALQKELEAQKNKNLKPPANGPRFSRVFWWAGIALTILSVLLYLVLSQPIDFTAEDLFTANFSPYPNELVSLQAQNKAEQSTEAQAVFQMYEQGNYAEASHGLEQLLAKSPDPDFRFYLGVAHLANDRNTEAILTLSEVISQQQTSFILPAKWYLALAYLKIGAVEDARVYLQELADEEGGFKSDRARAVLELLEEIR